MALLDEPWLEYGDVDAMPIALREQRPLRCRARSAPSTTELTAAFAYPLERVVGSASGSLACIRRPSLPLRVALAAALLDGHPLAAQPELLEAAAAAVVERHPNADADDVLLWAEGRASAA